MKKNMKRAVLAAVVFFVGLGAVAFGAEGDARKSALYGQQIIIETNPEDAAKAPGKAAPKDLVKDAANELANWLEKVTGKKIEIVNTPATGSASAIYLLSTNSTLVTAADRARLKDQGLEAFVIRGTSSQLQIIANDWRGLSHGVYFYLEQLGVRWLMAGANWTVVPQRSNIALAIDRLVAPAFFARSYGGTGGFYSNLFGRQYTGSAESRKTGIAEFEKDVTAWERHLRWGGQGLGHAMGEAFIADRTITPILAEHPEYLAKIDGKYTSLYEPAKNGGYVWNAATNCYIKAVPPGTGTQRKRSIFAGTSERHCKPSNFFCLL